MKKWYYLILVVALGFITCKVSGQEFEIRNGKFMLDGKPVQLICGEMHYTRIPREYWRDRLKRARAMGLNTISA